MNCKANTIVCTFLLLCSFGTAIAQHSIKGKVYDGKHEPLAGVSIVLTENAKHMLAKTDLTEKDGSYSLGDIAAGRYVLTAMLHDYQTYTSDTISVLSDGNTLPDIVLSEKNKTLNEVTISSQKPLIEIKADKIVVNVENSIVNTGSNVLEVLGRSPGVKVDQNDNITLKGRPGITIMIDGKISPVNGSDLANILKGMPASAIEKIELISNPGARYDASGSGGIINIKTKKEGRLGVNGSANVSYSQGVYPKANMGFSVNMRNKKLNVFASYNYSHRKGFSHLGITRKFYNGDTLKTTYTQSSDLVFPVRNHNAGFGIDYSVSPKTTIGLVLNGNANRFRPSGQNTSRVDSGDTYTFFTMYNNSKDAWYNYSANVYLKHAFDSAGQELSADIDYARYSNQTYQLYTNKYFTKDGDQMMGDSLLYGNISGTTQIRSAKLDYTLPFKQKYRFDAGAKSSVTTADNNPYYSRLVGADTIYDASRSNHFIYNENINAAYINGNADFKKWALQLGLRAEQTIASGEQKITNEKFNRNYAQFFPSLGAQYHLSDKHDIGFTLSRRIDRPNYQQLNPFRFFVDFTNFKTGNPYLRPALTYAMEISYTYKQRFITSFSYNMTSDIIVEVLQANPSQPNQSFQTDVNLQGVNYYCLSGAYPIQVFKWWNSVTNVNGYYNFFKGDISNTSLRNGGPAFDINTTNTFTLPKSFSAELSCYYQAPQVWGFYDLEAVWSLNLGVQKSFFSRKLVAKVAANDLFRTSNQSASIRFNNFYEYFESRRDSRVVNFSLVYRFGKNGAAARRHGSGAEDEKKRAGGGGA